MVDKKIEIKTNIDPTKPIKRLLLEMTTIRSDQIGGPFRNHVRDVDYEGMFIIVIDNDSAYRFRFEMEILEKTWEFKFTDSGKMELRDNSNNLVTIVDPEETISRSTL